MVALLAAPAVAGGVGKAVAMAYGAPVAARGIATFFDTQFQTMKASDNAIVEQTGRILEAATLGYGIGYIAPVAIIAAGQLILGNPLGAIGTVGSAAILANPIAATCAAAGALYYGYAAMTNAERTQLIESLAQGLKVGTQLVLSILDFFLTEMKKALSSDMLSELKASVAEYAATFGNGIADITRTVADKLQMGLSQAYDGAIYLRQNAGEALASAAVSGSALAGKAFDQLSGMVGNHAASKKAAAMLPDSNNSEQSEQS